MGAFRSRFAYLGWSSESITTMNASREAEVFGEAGEDDRAFFSPSSIALSINVHFSGLIASPAQT